MIAAIAWALAGIALWFTRAVLEISGDARQSTRVAMFPSIPELAGFLVLTLVIFGGLAALFRRWKLTAFERDRARLQTALPLIALGLLVLPFVPWIPDLLLPARALAGPLAFVLWWVVAGHVLITLLSLQYTRNSSVGRPGAIFLVFLATLALTAAAGLRMRDTLGYPSGSEPHYLLSMQSLALDGDLKLRNNYDRHDYDQYFPTMLSPESGARSRDGEIYSPNPPGLAIIGALPYRLGGYHGVLWLLVLITALTGTLAWRWTYSYTGSAAAATMGWAGVFAGAPLVFSGIAVYPDVIAALCLMAALGWRWDPGARPPGIAEYAFRGAALALLPWLSITLTPTAVAVAAILAMRARGQRGPAAALLGLLSVSLLGWLGYFGYVWGEWSPLAPFGNQRLLGNPLSGALGLLFDQEFGILAYAPVLAVALIALVRMVRARDELTRLAGREIAITFATLFLSVAALAAWWGDSPHPARPLVPVLPLLALPLGWAYKRAADRPGQRAAYRTLVLIQLAVVVAILTAQAGALVIQDRDGSSRVLQWLSDLWPAWEVAPSVAAFGARQALPLVLLWCLSAAGVAWSCRRLSFLAPGSSSLAATLCIAAGMGFVAVTGPLVSRPPFEWVLEPDSRARVPMLDSFDAVARPVAVVYDPFTLVPPDAVPPLMTLAAYPGQRPGGQPVPVLLNARYALPAGEYEIGVGDVPSPVRGYIGLQVGRLGSPMEEWEVSLEPGEQWQTRFTLPADAEFVGLVGDRQLQEIRSLHLRPVRVVNQRDRAAVFHGGPPLIVYSALKLPGATLFFHDDAVYPETSGIWVRGAATATMTISPEQPRQGITLRVHSGKRPNRLTFTTSTWGERVALTPGVNATVTIPPPPTHGPFVLRISSEGGFVPADEMPGSEDRRLLGGWVEVAP